MMLRGEASEPCRTCTSPEVVAELETGFSPFASRAWFLPYQDAFRLEISNGGDQPIYRLAHIPRRVLRTAEDLKLFVENVQNVVRSRAARSA